MSGGEGTAQTGRGRASIDEALKGMLAGLGGRTHAPDEPAGMTAARIVDRLNGGDGGPDLPEFLALVPLGYWLAEMVRFFGAEPVGEETGAAAAQLLALLRGDGNEAWRMDKRYPGEILKEAQALFPSPEDVRKRRGLTHARAQVTRGAEPDRGSQTRAQHDLRRSQRLIFKDGQEGDG